MYLFLRIVKRFFILKGEEIVDYIMLNWTSGVIILLALGFVILVSIFEIIGIIFVSIFLLYFILYLVIKFKRWICDNWEFAIAIEKGKSL